jgi:hypothetical protein
MSSRECVLLCSYRNKTSTRLFEVVPRMGRTLIKVDGDNFKDKCLCCCSEKKMLAIDRQCLNITKIEVVKPEIVTS